MPGMAITSPIRDEVPTARLMSQPQVASVGTVKEPPPIPTSDDIRPMAER